ncbi:Bug family tripartite tricarboxylate transporter substrate binding protein [Limnohabitans sp.]|uniref:Bug family tripartite tricarboxylate transporter substrate binding protein n=1 Tax=Limnohabitans sp. TaxID=1907725 RepID=UPI0038B8654C
MNTFIRCVIALGVMALSAASAVADDKFPSKPLKLVVPLAAGGGNDAVARILAESMAKHLGQAVIVENRTGAGGNVGTDFVAKSPADGYTLIHVSNSVVVNPYLYKKLPFDIQKDLTSVGLIATTPMFILAHPSSSVTNLRELIDQMKLDASKLSYATPGNGTPHHFAMELLKTRAGSNLAHVPYRGAAPAVTDVVGGQVPILVSTSQSVADFVATGRLKMLATMDPTRVDKFKDTPAVAELVPGFGVSIWHGLMVPAKTPPAALSALTDALSKTLMDPEIQRKLMGIGFSAKFESPSAMQTRIAAELETWKTVAKSAGITPE